MFFKLQLTFRRTSQIKTSAGTTFLAVFSGFCLQNLPKSVILLWWHGAKSFPDLVFVVALGLEVKVHTRRDGQYLADRVQVFCDLLVAYQRAEEGLSRLDLADPLRSARAAQALVDDARATLDAQLAEWGGEMRPGRLTTQNAALRILLEMAEAEVESLRARVAELEDLLAETVAARDWAQNPSRRVACTISRNKGSSSTSGASS